MSKKVLVTGGAGFVGSNLVDRLLSNGEQVIVYDNLFRPGVEHNIDWLKSNWQDKFEFVKEDVCNAEKIQEAAKDVDAIYHTAGQTAVTTSVSNPRQDFEINALGTFNVLEAARKSEKDPVVIYTSTNKVYGDLEDVKIAEREKRYEFEELVNGVPSERPIEPHTPYGCSKATGDSYCLDYNRIYGLKTVVFRMSCIYGTRQFGCIDQGWVAHFITSYINKNPLTIFGDGKQIRDVLFVDDLVNAFIAATENIDKTAGQPYAIGGGAKNTMSLIELVKYIEERGNRPFDLSYDEWRPSDQKVYYSDVSKAKKDFGWEPKIDPKEGVNLLYSWIEKNKELFK
ncbi:SDR family NAD(P)-dependent oxidoreductase [Candidatus Undinarchaeota archaeon]